MNKVNYKMLRNRYKKRRTRHFLLYFLLIVFTLLFLFAKVQRRDFNFKSKYYALFETRLNTQTLTLEKHEKGKVYLIGINKRVRYSSSDTTVVVVDMFGNIYAVGSGRAVIYVETTEEMFECLVIVK